MRCEGFNLQKECSLYLSSYEHWLKTNDNMLSVSCISEWSNDEWGTHLIESWDTSVWSDRDSKWWWQHSISPISMILDDGIGSETSLSKVDNIWSKRVLSKVVSNWHKWWPQVDMRRHSHWPNSNYSLKGSLFLRSSHDERSKTGLYVLSNVWSTMQSSHQCQTRFWPLNPSSTAHEWDSLSATS